MLAADSNATGSINGTLDDCGELQQNDTYDNDLNDNNSSDEVNGGSDALSRLNQLKVSRRRESSVNTKDNDEDNILCRAIKIGR